MALSGNFVGPMHYVLSGKTNVTFAGVHKSRLDNKSQKIKQAFKFSAAELSISLLFKVSLG